ncbi:MULTISPECIES: hypothetical protein [Streptomyces]|uniref:hypothetical protein n=1 Tax=Streptomyces TaxID=1883 RepID=UPI000AA632D8|nr:MULTISPECIES: hypothetical protein [Streptomyces]WUC25885.1 hypothetical protein OG927_00205 [Streptomyces clavifer]WUC31927.1 hypothetical protein OG927_33385 [Streptomyces clavifer]
MAARALDQVPHLSGGDGSGVVSGLVAAVPVPVIAEGRSRPLSRPPRPSRRAGSVSSLGPPSPYRQL